MAVSWGEILREARRQAREHNQQAASFLVGDWERAMRAVWPVLWTRYPEAYHVDGTLVGALPVLEETLVDATEIPVEDAYASIIGAGMAAYCLESMVPTDAEAEALGSQVAGLWNRFEAGLMPLSFGSKGGG